MLHASLSCNTHYIDDLVQPYMHSNVNYAALRGLSLRNLNWTTLKRMHVVVSHSTLLLERWRVLIALHTRKRRHACRQFNGLK